MSFGFWLIWTFITVLQRSQLPLMLDLWHLNTDIQQFLDFNHLSFILNNILCIAEHLRKANLTSTGVFFQQHVHIWKCGKTRVGENIGMRPAQHWGAQTMNEFHFRTHSTPRSRPKRCSKTRFMIWSSWDLCAPVDFGVNGPAMNPPPFLDLPYEHYHNPRRRLTPPPIYLSRQLHRRQHSLPDCSVNMGIWRATVHWVVTVANLRTAASTRWIHYNTVTTQPHHQQMVDPLTAFFIYIEVYRSWHGKKKRKTSWIYCIGQPWSRNWQHISKATPQHSKC